MKRQELLEAFARNKAAFADYDPSGQARTGNIYGLPHSSKEAVLHVHRISSAITVSGTEGAERGPGGLLKGSECIELFNKKYHRDAWIPGMYLFGEDNAIIDLQQKGRDIFEKMINPATFENVSINCKEKLDDICALLNSRVEHMVMESIKQEHLVAVVGGCHSSIYGNVAAHAKYYGDFSILQFDAHLDLREAYEGAEFSHASIMWNILKNIEQVKKIVPVGIRSNGLDEHDFVQANKDRVTVFYDDDMREQREKGKNNWYQICADIIDAISTKQVYISFDHDGLEVQFSGSTGTPVSGGLSVWQAKVLIEMLAKKKTIIGFDLNELVPDTQNDRNSAAEIFYHMYYWTVYSQGGFESAEIPDQTLQSERRLPQGSMVGPTVVYGGTSQETKVN